MTNTQDTRKSLTVSIKSKNKNLYEGSVTTLTSKNDRGVFDILSFHTNFITLIREYIIIDKGLPTEKGFNFEKGVLYVLSNKVEIYVGI